MNSLRNCTASRLIGRLLTVLCLFAVLAASPAAIAQAPESGLSPDQAKALSDLLNDPKTRGAIVEELQRIAESAPPALFLVVWPWH